MDQVRDMVVDDSEAEQEAGGEPLALGVYIIRL